MRPILITSCSSRKTVPVNDRLQAATLPQGTLTRVAAIWKDRLKNHHCKLTASALYNGRGAREALKAADASSASHWIISAGLGLISATEEVPAYDLTVSGTGSNQIQRKIVREHFDSRAWWRELAKRRRPHRTLTHLVTANPRALILVALPANYLSMVLNDLTQLGSSDLKRLRIVGSTPTAIPDALRSVWLPYDERLDSPLSPIRGTRSDFPQRAARHFFEIVWPHMRTSSAVAHTNAVSKALVDLPFPFIEKRKRLDDAELLSNIKRLWERAGGKSGRMLRILRDDESIACEQGRFKVLFKEAKRQLGISK